MRAPALATILIVAVALAACKSDRNPFDPSKPIDKMTREELCDYYKFFLTDPNLSAQTRQVATAKMREKACPA